MIAQRTPQRYLPLLVVDEHLHADRIAFGLGHRRDRLDLARGLLAAVGKRQRNGLIHFQPQGQGGRDGERHPQLVELHDRQDRRVVAADEFLLLAEHPGDDAVERAAHHAALDHRGDAVDFQRVGRVLFECGQDVGVGHGELVCRAIHFLFVGVPLLVQLLQFGETPAAEIAFGRGGIQLAVGRHVGLGDFQGNLLGLAIEGSEQLVLLHAVSFMDRETGDDSRLRRDQVQLPNRLGETFDALILHVVVRGLALCNACRHNRHAGQPARASSSSSSDLHLS